jgi:hypothetical protein
MVASIVLGLLMSRVQLCRWNVAHLDAIKQKLQQARRTQQQQQQTNTNMDAAQTTSDSDGSSNEDNEDEDDDDDEVEDWESFDWRAKAV